MKELIKIRKKWLLDPSTKIEQTKKDKQKYKQEEDKDWKNLTGYIDQEDLQELEDLENDKE